MSRDIKTAYYNMQGDKVKTNTSTDSNRAVAQCVLHMQVNHYGARVAEVWDGESGELHAAIKRDFQGNIKITYKRDPKSYERRIAMSALID